MTIIVFVVAVTDDSKSLDVIDGNGYQWMLSWGVAPTVYMGTSGLSGWKGQARKGLRV